MGQVIDIMARHLFKMMFVAPSILLVIASMAPEVQSREPQLSDMSGVAPFDDTATASLADILASTQDALERYQNQESRYNTPYSSHRRTGSNTAGSGSGSGSGVITVEPTSAATSEPTDAPTVGPAGSGSGSGSGTASPTYAPSSEPTTAGSGSGSGSGTASPTYLPTSTPTAEPTPLATTPPDTGNAPTYEPTRAPTAPTAAPTLGVDEVMTIIVQVVNMEVPYESALEMLADLSYMTMIEMGYAQYMELTEIIDDIIQYLQGVSVDASVDDTRRGAVGVTYSTQISSTSNVNVAQAQAGVTNPAALVNSMNSVLNTLAAANPTKYASIQAPTTNGMTIQAAVVTTTTAAPASASSGTDNTLYIIIGVVGGVLLIAGVIAAVFIFTRSAPEAEHFESPGSVGLTQELIPMSMGNIDSETLELNDLHNLDEQGEIRQDRYAPA